MTLYTRALVTAMAAVLLLVAGLPASATSISEAKSAPGSAVNLSGVIVTGQYYDNDGAGGYLQTSFSVENPDRSNGVRVISDYSVNPGEEITVSGVSAVINGEPVIQADTVNVDSMGNPVPSPVGMSNRTSGGLNEMGMLVKLWGKVTESVDTADYSGYLYIDDGSGLDDGSGHVGIRCGPAAYHNGSSPAPLPSKGSYVLVTGVIGMYNADGSNARYFWTNSITTVSTPVSTGMVDWRQFSFGTSTDAWGYAHPFITNLTGVTNPVLEGEYSIVETATSTCITVTGTNKRWLGFCDAGTIGNFQGQLNFYGGEVIQITYSFQASGPNQSGLSLQYYGGEWLAIATAGNLINDGNPHVLSFTMPASSVGKALSALWVTVHNPRPGLTRLCLMDFTIQRDPSISNRIDADTILATPPARNARVGMVNGAMAMIVDDVPITGMGWASLIDQTTSDEMLADVVGATGFKCSRVTFALGEQCYNRPNFYPPTWLGPNLFDWSYLGLQVNRFLTANPQTRLILLVDLDGAIWWTKMHPDASGVASNIGVPDYLSPEWRRDVRDAIRQMVAHIQSSSYAGAVIGYELINGATLDCNYEINDSTPSALSRFRAWLQDKYGTVAALRAAWGDSIVTFGNAVPEPFFNEAHPYDQYNDLWSFLPEPGARPRYQDSAAFRNHVYQQVILDFSRNIKEATQRRAIVGARTGDFMGQGSWLWNYPMQERYPIDELLRSDDFDFFDIQESYFGRSADGKTGSGVPALPPQGLAARNKLVVIQNDWRTHTGPDMGYGATANMQETVQTQRRVFVNCLALGMSQYLWQQSYFYNIGDDGQRDLTLVDELRKMDEIARKSLYTDRSSGAQVAFVFDEGYSRCFGYNSDPYYYTPSKGAALFDDMKYTWARAGVPFDMIFLDQLPTAKPYKVYVFVHTVGLTDSQIDMIHSVVGKNGNVGIFMWADGLMDGQFRNAARMSTLTGMSMEMQLTSRTWQMNPTQWAMSNLGVTSGTPMGTLTDYYQASAAMPFYPTFVVNDQSATAIAVYQNTSDVGIAKKELSGWTSIYTGSANIVPPLLRYALTRTGVFQYTGTDDISYINNSFIGLHPKTTGTITLTLPSSSALFDVFGDQERAASATHNIPVAAGNTYLFYRGTRTQWDSLGQ